MLEGLKERLGIGGQVAVFSEKQKMVKLILMILVPFYIVWGMFNFLFFFGYPMEWSMIVLVCGFFGWGCFIVILMNQRQMEASQYICFRQAKWRMSVTDRIAGDLYIDRDIEYEGLLGGYQIYRPHFPFGVPYRHPTFNNGEGVVINEAYWLLPDKWEETFYHVPQQEAWYGSLPVAVMGEDLTLHNIGWGIKYGKYIPIAIVKDSNRHYEATLGRVALEEKEKAPKMATLLSQIGTLTRANMDLSVELAQEVQANKGLTDSTDNLKRLKEEALQDIKKRHGDIKRMPTNRFANINWRLVVLGIALIGVFVTIWYWIFTR